nr:MAG TPA: hypothetical protein [Caudoviricetes sp.]
MIDDSHEFSYTVTLCTPVSFSRRQKECLSLPMSIPTKYIRIHPFKKYMRCV